MVKCSLRTLVKYCEVLNLGFSFNCLPTVFHMFGCVLPVHQNLRRRPLCEDTSFAALLSALWHYVIFKKLFCAVRRYREEFSVHRCADTFLASAHAELAFQVDFIFYLVLGYEKLKILYYFS